MRKVLTYLAFAGLIGLSSCNTDPAIEDPYVASPYVVEVPPGLGGFPYDVENPPTVEGVKLGRMLFYDPILSRDSSQSCFSCHNPDFAFTDNGRRFSKGVGGIPGTFNSMPIFNLAWHKGSGFFWNGRAKSLVHQAEFPVADAVELHEVWENIALKLQRHPQYPQLFYEAFGTKAITKELTGKAIAQFESIIVSGNNDYMQWLINGKRLSQDAMEGMLLFNGERGDCFHCHNPGNNQFTDFSFRNNGLDAEPANGLAASTGNVRDIGKFKVPTLMNLKYTAPYMHDGRFQTLDQVLDFYSTGSVWSPTRDPVMDKHPQGLQLTDTEKRQLKAFLMALTDSTFMHKPEYQNPF